MKALILGGTSDLGRSIGKKYAVRGWDLVLTARNTENLVPIQSDFQIRHEIKVDILELDAAAIETHASVLTTAKIEEIDTVVYAIGYLGEQEKAQSDFAENQAIVMSNYVGAISLLNRVAEVFEKRGSGTIIGISSVAGERGRQSNYIYGSAKAGFTTYLDGMRNRLAHKGVHVMTVKPGFLDTKMTAGLDLPGPLTATADKASNVIVKGALKKKNKLYVLFMWRWIMLIIRNIPEPIFKKLKL